MSTSTENVAVVYGKIASFEGTRLAEHPMERELTLRTIRANLPPTSSSSPVKIADIGGGPGKIAFPLADDGHRVDLVDLTPELVAMAQAEQDKRIAAASTCSAEEEPGSGSRGSGQHGAGLLQSISVGNALHAPELLPAGTYDAVLLLGPLYHLLEVGERVAAVDEALRLARPGTGVVFCAFVSVAAHLRDIAVRDPAKLVRARDFYAKYLHNGKYDTFKESFGVNVQGYHTCAADTRAFLATHFADKAELVELRSTEGILGGGLDSKLEDAGAGVVQAWADLMYDQFSTREEFLGCADHLIAVLRRK